MEKNKVGIINKIKGIKGIEYIIIAVVVLISLFVLFGEKIFSKSASSSGGSPSEYASLIEDEIERTVSRISGVGRVEVAVTVSGGNRTVVAKDITTVKNGNEVQTTETTVIIGGKVVVLCELYPEISGVLIVAGGADDLSVKLKILSAVTTLLDIEEDKIEIVKGK
ncbi:MAG: hypothetical protein IJV67_00885 [Clostridia bacterium]|nr:hypothetical protein [Clostridia bacterium]